MNTCAADEDSEALEKRFSASFEQLDLDPHIQYSALTAYRRFDSAGGLSSAGGDDAALEWLCCSVYSELQRAKIEDIRAEAKQGGDSANYAGEVTKGNCWNLSLTRLLRSFKVNVSRFLRRMQHWNWLAQNEEAFQQEVEELRRRLGITMILLQHYKRIFQQIFVLPGDDSDADALAMHQSLYEFGWLLFLVIRNELPGFVTSNLVSGCQVLVCSMDLLYVNALEVPNSEVIRRDFAGVPSKWTSSDFDDVILHKYSALEAIGALIPELPMKGVIQMKNAFFHKALMVLFMDQSLLGDDTHMREIVKEGMLDVNLSTLNRKYSSHVADISEMDERVLLCCQESKEKAKDTKASPKPAPSPCSTPSHKRLLAQRLPQKLTASIVGSLEKEDDGNSAIVHVEQSLSSLGQKFTDAVKDFLDPAKAEERFRLASGFYYHFLEKIVASEVAQKPRLMIGHLLQQRTLNETLLVCCLELALHIQDERIMGLGFPFILDCYSLDAYEFQKILEVVVRHDQGFLGRELVKHLHAVEEKCLESLIFRKNSQLWRSLGTQDCLPGYQMVQAEGKENGSTAAGICLRKFYGLASRRLLLLCKSLCLVESYSQIWHLAEHSFTLKRGELLRQRHLDQLLLCAIQLHVRLEDLRITFSLIIQHYRRQPHAQSSIYRAVSLDEGLTGDIIRFYNRVYVRSMASYGRQLHCNQSLKSEPQKDLNVLQEASPNQRRMRWNICVSSPPPPKICLRGSCSSIPTQSTSTSPMTSKPAANLKRTLSHKEPREMRGPIILRRRTSFE
ncbi:hypothetical protein KR009_006767 [Drosophila setifemur]|nr:hypothetical protein KR009_006767 [Drosophila setifemur]